MDKGKALKFHSDNKGKLEVRSKVKLENKDDMSLAYTPGVAEPCREIAKDKGKVYDYTMKGNSVAVISDGSAVLGLGNIGAEAALPVMEGKAILFKEFAGIDAFPICLASQDLEENIKTIRNIAPVFGGINLEDFGAPDCFELEKKLQDLGIPVIHDDQHGTAVVVLAGLINSMKVVDKDLKNVRVVISGVGAAGVAIMHLLLDYGVSSENVVLCDSRGILGKTHDYSGRHEYKKKFAEKVRSWELEGSLRDALVGADVFVGVSGKGLVDVEMVKSMAKDSVVFALANPDPEILPEDALEGGAKIIATGRSDFPNQVNNVLAFPGIFRGALNSRADKITEKMKVAAAEALAESVKDISADKILPNALDKDVVSIISKAVSENKI